MFGYGFLSFYNRLTGFSFSQYFHAQIIGDFGKKFTKTDNIVGDFRLFQSLKRGIQNKIIFFFSFFV